MCNPAFCIISFFTLIRSIWKSSHKAAKRFFVFFKKNKPISQSHLPSTRFMKAAVSKRRQPRLCLLHLPLLHYTLEIYSGPKRFCLPYKWKTWKRNCKPWFPLCSPGRTNKWKNQSAGVYRKSPCGEPWHPCICVYTDLCGVHSSVSTLPPFSETDG